MSKRHGHIAVKAAVYQVLCLAAYNACAQAVCTNVVRNTFDSGPGSLRAAVANASDGETITFCPSVTGTIVLTNGELLVTNSVTILGPGANVLTVSGNQANRVIHIVPGVSVTIANLTIANGSAVAGIGGGIWNAHSTLVVTNCTISGNSAVHGGGIFNDGEPPGSATLTIVNSTVVGNSATLGGGVLNDGSVGTGSAMLLVANSTISGNSARNGGGGIFNVTQFGGNALLVIVNSTVSRWIGGGIVNYNFNDGNSTTVIGSTIISDPDLDGSLGVTGPIISLGYNISTDYGGGFLMATGDQFFTDPMLGPLQMNGGQTPTHAISCDSPAVNAGTNVLGLATDQRGDAFPANIRRSHRCRRF